MYCIAERVDDMLHRLIKDELNMNDLEHTLTTLRNESQIVLKGTYAQDVYHPSMKGIADAENQQLFTQIRQIFEDLMRALNPASYKGNPRADAL